MVTNSTIDVNKTNNYLSPQCIVYKKDHAMPLEISRPLLDTFYMIFFLNQVNDTHGLLGAFGFKYSLWLQGQNSLCFKEMMIRSTLICTRLPHFVGFFIVLAHWNAVNR